MNHYNVGNNCAMCVARGVNNRYEWKVQVTEYVITSIYLSFTLECQPFEQRPVELDTKENQNIR